MQFDLQKELRDRLRPEDIWPFLRKGWWLILGMTLLATLVAGTVAAVSPREYRATAVIRIVPVQGQEVKSRDVLDLDVRGLDDMVAAPPESMPSFSWLDAASDLDALVSARHDARELLRRDPGLRRGPNLELARYLRARWDALLGTPCPVQVNAAGGNRRRRRRRRR